MNKWIGYGNVGKDPEVHKLDGGKTVAKFSLATTEHSKDKDGNKVSNATWHNIVVWDKLAELCEKHVKKGSSLILEGKISYRSYEDKDGNTKYFTEIVCNNLQFI
jgi:single-strand DNA-binding protein